MADEDPQLLADTRKMLGEKLVFVIKVMIQKAMSRSEK
jgi:hypothetical protein